MELGLVPSDRVAQNITERVQAILTTSPTQLKRRQLFNRIAMAKLPKPPRSIPTKRTLPTKSPLPLHRQMPRGPPGVETLLRRPEPTPRENWQKVWSERPKLSDLQRLSEEELKSAQHQAKLRRWRQWPMFGIGLIAFGMGTYGAMLY
jgi:methyltransferase OMS1